MKYNSLKILSILGLIAIIYFLTNDIGYCAASAAQTAQSTADTVSQTAPAVNNMHNTIIKFVFAMGGVVLSSVLIFAGLTVYNKIFVKNPHYASSEDDVLKTPKTVDDAIIFFLKKNRLK